METSPVYTVTVVYTVRDCEGKMSSGGCVECGFLSDCLKNNPSANELLQKDRERLLEVLPAAEKDFHRDGCLN